MPKPMIVPRRRTPSPPSERLAYSISETAKLLGCSERSLRSWMKAGKIHTRKIGGRVFVPLSSLEAFLAGSHSTGTDSTRITETSGSE